MSIKPKSSQIIPKITRPLHSSLFARASFFGSILFGIACVAPVFGAEDADMPNVILIVVDDVHVTQVATGLGEDDGYPAPLDITMTPALQKMAEEGVTMKIGYSANPMCWPSRGSVITGRYPRRWGDGTKVPVDELWASEYLKTIGYKTACIGKWHLRWNDKSVDTFKPLARGFDEFFGFLAGAHTYYLLEDNSTPVGKKQGPIFDGHEPATEDDLLRTKAPYNDVYAGDPSDLEKHPWYLTQELTAQTLDFIDRNHEDPFFIYLAYNARHTPGEVPDHFRERLTGEGSPTQETQAAMVLAVDDGVDEIYKKLESFGIADNTLVIFVGDNGGPANANRNGEPNQPFKGKKGDGWEGGKRIPFLVKWPKGLPAEGEAQASYPYPVMHIDVVPTILAAVGMEIPEKLDGTDLLPYLRGEKTSDPHTSLHWNSTARMGKWKYFQDSKKGNLLFDLEADPLEENNVIDANPEVAKEMDALVVAYMEETGRPGSKDGEDEEEEESDE